MNMLPPAIAMFSAILKKEGHKVKVLLEDYSEVTEFLVSLDKMLLSFCLPSESNK